VNASYTLLPDLLVRVSYARTLGRPNFNNVVPNLDIIDDLEGPDDQQQEQRHQDAVAADETPGARLPERTDARLRGRVRHFQGVGSGHGFRSYLQPLLTALRSREALSIGLSIEA
jgi:hypothetical protein